MTHSEHIKTVEAISKHVKMEEKCLKLYAPPSVAFVAKGLGPKGRKPYRGKKPKKGPRPPQNSRSNGGTVNKHKAKGNRAEDMTRVKCYNCGKKGYFARDCPEPSSYLFLLKLLYYMFVPTHSLLTLFLNGL